MDLDALRKQKQQRKQSQIARESSYKKKPIEPSEEAVLHFNLARCYDFGLNGYEIDEEKSTLEYLKAAELGHSTAMTEIGYDYADPEDSILGYDLDKAEYWGNKAIELGNPDGFYTLANIEINRWNGKKALDLLEEGIKEGSKDCIYNLAEHLYYGTPVADYDIEKNIEKAFILLNSIEWNEEDVYGTNAMALLGDIYNYEKEEEEMAIDFYNRAIKYDPNNYSAMTDLGMLFEYSEENKDLRRAKELLLTAAENDEESAMNALGMMYCDGVGCNPNLNIGLMWIRKAAEKGLVYAMENMGKYLLIENQEEAIHWYKKAADNGSEKALEELKKLGLPYSLQNSDDETDEEGNENNSLVQDIIDVNLDNLSSILDSKRSRFKEIIKDIQKTIDSDETDDYDKDRLRILQMALSFAYFEAHYLDEDFDKYEDTYNEIIDKIDEINPSMAYQNNEAEIIYLISNMYSIDRFQNVKPLDKLEQLWNDVNRLELDESQMEFKPSFWLNKAKETYELQKRIYSGSNNYYSNTLHSTSNSSLSVSSIYTKLKKILIEKLYVDEAELSLNAEFSRDLGADSLDSVEIMLEVEKEFGIMIPDDEAEKIITINDAIQCIKSHL